MANELSAILHICLLFLRVVTRVNVSTIRPLPGMHYALTNYV